MFGKTKGMNKLLLSMLLLGLAVSSLAQSNYGKSRTFRLSVNTKPGDYLPNVVIVKFKESSSAGAKTLSDKPTVLLNKVSVVSLTQKFPSGSTINSKDRSSVLRESVRIGLNRIYELKYSGNAGIETVINELLSDKSIEYAEPSYIHHLNYTPNDPLYAGAQSYLMQVKAPEAWDVYRNADGIIIGIVDSGSELTHEDLSANIAGGWDLVGADAGNFMEDNDPNVARAENDHGVHVSGLASAVSNNMKGVASIASNARLFIVKVAADNQPEDIYRGYDGIKYAADHGASVINCSWGSQDRSFYGEDIVNYAIARGCLIVAAAGNNGSSVPDYPAGYRGVIAVANVLGNDRKSSSSNYGGYVSIAAPGNNIYNTTFRNSYGYKSGTSMASPIVSSAAALVKSYYPQLSMQQVGELLRVTADNIYSINPEYDGKLGKGRLNVYRALTESAPSVRQQNITFEDDNNGRLTAGSVAEIYLDLKNFLMPVEGLKVTLKSSDSRVTVTDAIQNVGSIATLESKTRVGPFRVYISPDMPDNARVEFRIEYAGNNDTYQDFEMFTQTVALDYLNIVTDNLETTVTSNGRIGFSSQGQQGGLGFRYKGSQLLYEASLMIGNSASSVSNNARSSNGDADEHFVKRVSVKEAITDSTISGSSEFDDSGNPSRLKIDVRHKVTVNSKSPANKYIIAEYEVVNRSTSNLDGIYIGLFTDWDIDDPEFNATRYNAIDRLAYAYSANSTSAYAGVKLLTTSAQPAYYPLSLSTSPLGDGNFTTAEKYTTLSSGIRQPGAGSSGTDISFVSGYGPFTIAANGSVKVAFALGGGTDLSDLQQNLMAAQIHYDNESVPAGSSAVLYTYPNPVTPYYNNNITTVVNLPDNAVVSLDLFNLTGQRVKSLLSNTSLDKGIHRMYYNFSDLSSGIYLLRMRYNNSVKTHKISVVK
ncbi:T9SS type A sorting domain-containing protein [Arcticibacter tournemirensis]|uniref:T9SS type A sorting domain-containing protein n=2 Tax=Arcticibacter tournemirensis TaxID=699437 RepID=A0A4Q0M5S6_9SPHI|nr:T9SS type A sorting domain-containing protein [Arcticibacter tournemirensis]